MSNPNYVKLVGAAALGVIGVRFIYKRLVGDESPADRNSTSSSSKSAAVAKTSTGDEQAKEEGVWIYFGSQSGTAQTFSEELAEEAAQHDVKATVVDMEEFDPDEFVQHKCVVLVVATYGEGDPTDNAVEFFKWVQDKSLGADTLQGMSFTVMGLGNRQYVNFNSCGKAADEHMERLGAHRIYSRGEGDDDQNIEEDFEVWKEGGVWPALQTALGVTGSESKRQDAEERETAEQVEAKLQLKAVVSKPEAAPTDPLVQVGGADIFGKWYFSASKAPVSTCRELLQKPDAEAGRTTKHIDFDISSFPALDWRTADNLEVLAPNPDEDVEWFAKRLGVFEELDRNVTFVKKVNDGKTVRKPFPAPCNVHNALSVYCDLAVAPVKMIAKRFAAFIEDEQDRACLDAILQDREAWQWLTGDGVRLTFREFFELFMTSAKVDFSTFVQICPRQRNRPYTIASSSKEDPKKIGICVSIVQEDGLCDAAGVVEGLASRGHPAPRAGNFLEQAAQGSRRFRGLCSTALCTRLERGDKMWINVRSSTFRLPRRNTVPVIMIGAGTGMAPFRAFLREFIKEEGVRKKTMLFFGCRRRDEDFLYQDELEKALEDGVLSELITAFSREQERKVYVQDKLRERGAEVAELLLKQGAHLYVCGSTSMGKSIQEELIKALGSQDHLDRLKKEGRIVEELW
jgi:NADPH-ferrihemoprotein reductase